MINLSKEILDLREYIVRTRRFLHKNPELSLEEYKTAAFIRNELSSFGIDYENVGETGTIGFIKGENPGPTIVLRADIDALPMDDLKLGEHRSSIDGVCHSCGHDGHTTSLLAASRVLNANKHRINGTVKLIFEQAEEISRGARQFIDAGHLNDVDYVFGIHAASYFDVGVVSATIGPSMASCDTFKIRINGVPSHAATPNLGSDAALATANILVSLQNIVSRQINPFEPVVVSIGKMSAGSSFNVVAQHGYLEGTLRTLNSKTRIKALAKIEEIAKSVALIHNCQADFTNSEDTGVLVNDAKTTEYVQEAIVDIVGDQHLITNTPPSLGAEDFSEYLKKAPGCFIKVGTRSGQSSSYPHHHGMFDMDEEGLLVSAQIFLNLVYRISEIN